MYARLHRDIAATVKNGFGRPPMRADAFVRTEKGIAAERTRHEFVASRFGAARSGQAVSATLEWAGAIDVRQRAFVTEILPHASRAGAVLGVSPEVIVAHAALESGWGQRPLRHADGRTSHNLFGIKATRGWRGEVVDSNTTEYFNGEAVKTVERFRSYRNYANAFDDYANLLGGNVRYAGALNRGGDADAFAMGLVRGGYATDPRYAEKLAQVMAQIREISR
ncbi:flagellar assembly peptidoglycan hydrolase FlgJ [Burkholderia semiarida]|uniref:Flagellar assembly peptidoglycan hydrolase FlgJ n=1 Tax=Burkholderia semiarida TaxID=2843303 RepID=A0ABW7L9F3_9BURK